MKNRTIKILLFISLAFNIAFLGSGIFRFIKFRELPPIHKRIKNKKVRDFMQHRKEMDDPLMRDFSEAKDRFMKALTKPEIDEAEMQTMIDELIQKQNAMERDIGNSMIELRKQLSNEEAKEVFGKFQRWMQPPNHEHPAPRRKLRKN